VRKLDPAIHELASGPKYAVLATLMSDGWPQTSGVWVESDSEHLLVNTEVHRPYGIPVKSERVILRIEPVHQVPPQM
jgi:hypothetical protein